MKIITVKNGFSRVFAIITVIGCTVLILGGLFLLANVFIAFPIAFIQNIVAGPEKFPDYVFDNIGELEKLTPYITEELIDDDIDGFEPVESFVATVTWENSEFDIYAYEFESFEENKQYVYMKEKRTLTYDDPGFFGTGNLLYSTTTIVYSNENIIIIHGPSQKKTDAFYLWLQEDFTVPLK